MAFAIFRADVKSILSPTSGFIAQAGFTHSLTPARNCGFGCAYCYVPTMGIYGGLKPEDWRRWGAFTTFKANAPALLARSLRPHQVIYCSPLVDPYQPESIADGIYQVLSDEPLRRTLRKKGIERAHQFSWEQSVGRVRAIYGEVLRAPALAVSA